MGRDEARFPLGDTGGQGIGARVQVDPAFAAASGESSAISERADEDSRVAIGRVGEGTAESARRATVPRSRKGNDGFGGGRRVGVARNARSPEDGIGRSAIAVETTDRECGGI